MTIAEGIKRSFPLLIALILLAVGWWVGGEFAARFIMYTNQCEPTGARLVTGGLGGFATVMSVIFSASKAGFIHVDNLLRFVRHGDREQYHWFSDGTVLAVAGFVFSGLLSFSWGAALDECDAPPSPSPLPICETAFVACKGSRTESDCRLCNVEQEIQAAREEIDRLQLERVGAFPLLFENAGTDGDKLSQRGIQLAPGQLATWHRKLFGDAPWPAAATRDVAYCVVGFSSRAPFAGRKDSNELNVRAAQCRADSVAAELPSVLDQAAPQIASCRWCSYGAMARPRLRSGEHLATSDKHLISRSVFVHGFRVTPEDGFDVGATCRKLMAQKLGVDGDGGSCLSCSTFVGKTETDAPWKERNGLVG